MIKDKEDRNHFKSINRVVYDEWYQSGLSANVDWIAGGNFDGSISRLYLKFVSDTNIAELRGDILCRMGGRPKTGVIVKGTFEDGGQGAINVIFEGRGMRGFVLGDNNEFIAFDVYFSNFEHRKTEAFELKY